MKIFRFHTADNQAYVYNPGDREACIPDPPRSLAKDWSPPTFEIIGKDEYRSFLPKRDFVTYLPDAFFVTSRAANLLRPTLTACGEFLPVQLSNDRDTLYLFNVTSVINAVDMRRSEFCRIDGEIMYYEKLVFDRTLIPADAMFFKSTQAGTMYVIYATELAVAAIKKARLTGYEFEVVWSDDPQD